MITCVDHQCFGAIIYSHSIVFLFVYNYYLNFGVQQVLVLYGMYDEYVYTSFCHMCVIAVYTCSHHHSLTSFLHVCLHSYSASTQMIFLLLIHIAYFSLLHIYSPHIIPLQRLAYIQSIIKCIILGFIWIFFQWDIHVDGCKLRWTSNMA